MKYTDHEGNEFKTFENMCNHWGKSAPLVRGRVKQGLTLGEALTLEDRRKECKAKDKIPFEDHLGKVFESLTDAANHYGMCSQTVKYRLSKGWSVEEALTIPVYANYERDDAKKWTDHLGNTYKTKGEMVKFDIDWYCQEKKI